MFSAVSNGPLAGLRLIEAGVLLAGPWAGRLAADWGAEVIKLEAPSQPDPFRDWGHASTRYHGKPLWWPVQSRNKKCVTLDLRIPEGRELFLRLVEVSDAVVENFRPGTLERWGLDYGTLKRVNRGIILVRVSGFGQTGPYSSRPGYASVAEAMGGLRYINGYPDRPPPRMGISLGDTLAGFYAAMGLLAAVYERDVNASGEGQIVDVSLLESCFSILESALPEYDRLGLIRERTGTELPGVSPSNTYRASDGSLIVIGANQDSVFMRLCKAMGQPNLATDPRFRTHSDRARHQEQLDEIVQDWVATKNTNEVMEILTNSSVPCGPIYSIADIAADPHFGERQMLLVHDDPEIGKFLGPGIVPKFSRTPGALRWSAPWELGAANSEIYGDLLGLDDLELERLEELGVL